MAKCFWNNHILQQEDGCYLGLPVINYTYGMALMGYYPAVYSHEVDGIIFSSGTLFNPAAYMSWPRAESTGVSAQGKGYAMGGQYSNTPYDEIDSYDFVAQSTAAVTATLSVARRGSAGVYTFETGYAMGGHNNSTYQSEIDGIEYATEALVDPASGLSVATYSPAGIQSENYGYACGGMTGTGVYVDTVFRFNFNTQACGLLPAVTLGVQKIGRAGVSSSNYGYVMGGSSTSTTGGRTDYIDKFDFSSETVAAAGCVLAAARYGGAPCFSDDVGLNLGGSLLSGETHIVTGIHFATETQYTPTMALSVARYNAAGVQGGAA